MRAPQTVIRRPILTEKTTLLRETGGTELDFEGEVEVPQKIVFEVAPDANKIEIKHAVQKLFNVAVTDVHTLIARGKIKRVGRNFGRKPKIKKAIVTLRAGDSIEFFEGV